MRLDMRQRVTDSRAVPVDVVATALHNATDEAKMSAGKISSIKRDIRRTREKKFPPLPKSVSDWEIPDEWKTTGGASPKPFLIHDSGTGSPSRLVVFGTEEQLHFLAGSETWFMDGTFKMSSKLFQQVYVVRGEQNTQVRTCIYALMTGKTTEMYKSLLKTILGKLVDLGQLPRPKQVMVDFESAAMSAISSVLGDRVEVKGCFFHLCQSTWRHVQQHGLTKKYKENDDVKLYCGMIDALAFLPPKDVIEGMAFLWGSSPFDLYEVLHYFDATYVSGVTGERPKPPLFPPEVWNVHKATMEGSHRTNNVCESWNNKFNTLVGHHHPTIWTILEAIQKDESTERAYLLGSQPEETRKKLLY
ncbi:uncharacterized protein LOC128983212 [Macrosteles quadrilineatus]|uniref:uncharacterized protein LOC128983212 n=1 Tax=Macrosteles quadrilineatus TaxID=74068 RepID=UPI0023E0B292|nr:uncharacterized protein LOC128983212 [Macrosteles quadrilineatus]